MRGKLGQFLRERKTRTVYKICVWQPSDGLGEAQRTRLGTKSVIRIIFDNKYPKEI